jgi:hypothetical protein
MSTHGFFTSEGLQRLQKILDETCDDLGIARNSSYAKSSREFLAKELFRIQAPSLLDLRGHLSSFGHRYGLRQSRGRTSTTHAA